MVRSDGNFIALEQTSNVLQYMRKLGLSSESDNPHIIELRALQQQLRYGDFEHLDPVSACSPFISILRSHTLAGPFKLMALHALQTFINYNILLEVTESTPDALIEIVEAVTDCKIVQTDTAGDDFVQLQIVQTLHCIVKSRTRAYLTNEATWYIVEFCFTTLTSMGNTAKGALCSAAEKTVLEVVGFIFGCQISQSEDNAVGNKVGLPCALKVLGYFMGILQRHAAETGKSASKANRLTRSSSSTSSSSSGRINALADTRPLDSDMLELILALKIIHAVLLVDGTLVSSRALLLQCPPLACVLRDDLGKCLVLICAKREYPIVVIQSILNVFGTLVAAIGSTIRNTVECFMKQVYLKALHQTLGMLSANDDALNGLAGLDDKGGKGAVTLVGFSVEELEVIFESLSDIMADQGFIPSLFASFDCDPTKSDIIVPVIRYLSHCARYCLAAAGPHELGALPEVSTICLNCYSHILSALSDRSHSPSSSSLTDASYSSSAFIVSDAIRSARQAKLVLAEAATLFVTKPEKGLRFLQHHGALPTPLTPQSVARFLRIAPGLPKENAGAYLGELGKDSATYEADEKEFHHNVLLSYVQSFELQGQTVLNSLRIFLSAFRLPGEAQQIDRILVAFSDCCHASCVECLSGVLENAEVTYLLTFSIIMLNTDRHNQNIRFDRKMTLEQFVKNNTNYGSDVKQTVPLPREYLEEIYHSISEFPIRTERNDISGAVTSEVWMDLQLQATICPEKGLMVTTNFPPAMLKSMSDSLGLEFSSPNGMSLASMASQLLTSNLRMNPLALSAAIFQAYAVFDCDIVACLWQELLGVGVCPFLVSRMPPRMPDRSQPERYKVREANNRSLRVGIDIMVVLLRVGQAYSMQPIIDIVILLLTEFAGILRGQVLENLFLSLSLDYDFVQPNRSIVISSSSSSKDHASGDTSPRIQYRTVTMEEFVANLMHSLPARAALGTLLQVVHNNPTYIGSSWPVVLLALGYLRDASLLPREMVRDGEADLLPPMARTEFEGRLSAIERKKYASSQPAKKSTSLLSLQGLGEALFGQSEPAKNDASRQDMALSNGRWDAGYEDRDSFPFNLDSAGKDAETDPETIIMKDLSGSRSGTLDIADYDTQAFATAFGQLRELVSACGITSLVSGTKFLSEQTLRMLVDALINLAEAEETSKQAANIPASPVANRSRGASQDTRERARTSSGIARDNCDSSEPLDQLRSVTAIITNVCNDLPLPSQATKAWLEMILVDIALRNRDRFTALWPSLDTHYRRSLSGADQLSYVAERRVVGIFKMAERMIARDALAAPMLSLLGHVCISPEHAVFKTTQSSSTKPLGLRLQKEVSGQIAAGMWRLLTMNVASLPLLGLEQWQILFDIISTGAAAGGYASIKAFEALAWLLHEPRLRAEVPVFCVVGIKPLLCNNAAPLAVSVGAVHLLTHLHARLEVLVKDEDIGVDIMDSADGPVLWESCWVPILRSMADGVHDERAAVRAAAVASLTHAISDRHALVVPAGVLVDILGEIIVPTVILLGQGLVTAVTSSEQEAEKEEIIRRTQTRDEEILVQMLGLSSADDGNQPSGAASGSNGSLKALLTEPKTPVALGTTGELLIALTTAITKQLRKLVRYPSFDKLWLRVLHCMGFFLGAQHGFDQSVLIGRASGTREGLTRELNDCIECAREELFNMLAVLTKNNVFKGREGLQKITQETIQAFATYNLDK